MKPCTGLSYRQIAKLLGLSHATVAKIERRALAKMRAAMRLRADDVIDCAPRAQERAP